MAYKLRQNEALLTPLVDTLYQQISFVIEQKERKSATLLQFYLSNNPRKRAKEGWAKVTVDGKSTTLDAIDPEMPFTLEDANTKIEAVCRHKYTF
jgi:hypothetical protein